VSLEWGAGSGEQGKRERGAGIVVRNPEIDKFHQKYIKILMFLFKNSNFSENLDLIPWVHKNLLPSKIKESTYERDPELKK
jgi:hypothetical protein